MNDLAHKLTKSPPAADPLHPHAYRRRILTMVTGLSPQVVTETLYVLAIARRPSFVPTEICLLTTAAGAREAQLNLLHASGGWFHRLRADFGLPPIAFDESSIRVLRDRHGRPLEDIRELDHNECAADFIVDVVRELTADANAALHVSIAGGRKTIGFYLGYALSLYGRAQDRLSHVLVSEPFEGNHDFYYPTPYEHRIRSRRNGVEQTYDAAKARVDLAEIPFVRLRDELPRELLAARAPFSTVIAQAQRALPAPSLVVDPAVCRLVAGGEPVSLRPAELAFYWMFAERARNRQPGLHWSDKTIGAELLRYYARMRSVASGSFGRAEAAFQRGRGFTKDNFDPTKSRVHQALVQALGRRRAQPYLIQRLERIPGTRCYRQGLALPPEAIMICRTGFDDGGKRTRR